MAVRASGADGAALGVVARPERAPETLVEVARSAERAGYDELWLWEDCFLTGGVAAWATALAATERITVGLGVMPTPARNVAFAAMEIATLARLHPGRVHAGFGHGVDAWMRQVGAKPASQLALLSETVEAVQALLAGATVSVEGRYVRLRDVALDHPPAVVPPVSVGVRGPRSLELAGRCADGTVLDAGSSPGYVRWARERIAAERPHRLTVFLWCAPAGAARAAAEQQVAWRLATGGPQAEALAGEPDPVAAVVAAGPDDRAVADLRAAGADSVVLVPSDPAIPLDGLGQP
jgi:alkanesulfonate monooxygenase SsuD/methylene tetrahydromethanopterin reductase-like flavin-dependent oxidoreductase (luciferase family)